MSAAADDFFRWEDLDQRLISPKTNELAEEMHSRGTEAERDIGVKTAQSGNSAGYLPRLFDFHEKLVDEWAERLYAAYCEAWKRQNRTISPEFIRAVRDQPVAQLIAARKSSVRAQVCLRGMRIGEQPNPTALEEWDRRMDRLATRWICKLEGEAVACEYQLSKRRQNLRESCGWMQSARAVDRRLRMNNLCKLLPSWMGKTTSPLLIT